MCNSSCKKTAEAVHVLLVFSKPTNAHSLPPTCQEGGQAEEKSGERVFAFGTLLISSAGWRTQTGLAAGYTEAKIVFILRKIPSLYPRFSQGDDNNFLS